MREKLKNIEFLRFILVEILVLFHLRDFLFRVYSDISEYKYMDYALINGEQIVDFFFIISGFFLVYTFKNISTYDFIKKKIMRLFPTMFVVAVLYWIESKLGYIQFNMGTTILSDLLLFNSTGLVTTKGTMSAVWFVGVLFWVSIFYFYLIRYFDKKYVCFMIALMSWIGYTLLIQSRHGSLNGNSITIIYSFLSRGLIRGIAGVGLGCFLAYFYFDHIKKNNSKGNIYGYSCLEAVLLVYTFSHMTFYRKPINDELMYIILFCLILILFLIQKGMISRLLNNNYSMYLGRYSFCIFISHGLFLRIIKQIFPASFIHSHIILTPVLFLCICSLFAVVLHHFVEVPGAKLMKKLLFPQPATGVKNVENLERERERDSSCPAS